VAAAVPLPAADALERRRLITDTTGMRANRQVDHSERLETGAWVLLIAVALAALIAGLALILS
jgi:hypothetical protein